MGCDGGSIPRRDEMVKLKKKAEKADKDAELAAKWKHCALTSEELKRPIVACELGRLYNKEALLLALLDKSNLPDLAKHIRSLKDVVELKLTANPGYKAAAAADGYNDTQTSEYVCPVTGLEMSGRYRFAYLRGCGCVFSEKALKEVPSEMCHKCGSPFKAGDIVVLNGTGEDIKRQRDAMLERRLLAKQAKASKKKRKAEVDLSVASTSTSSEATSSKVISSTDSEAISSISSEAISSTSSEAISSTSSEATNVSSEEDRESPPVEKKPRLEVPSKKEVSSKKSSVQQRQAKLLSASQATGGSSKLRAGSSVAALTKKTAEVVESTFKPASEDQSARKVYKSLFNSSASERPKERTSNWITYNPYF